jgi:hypothetical protein
MELELSIEEQLLLFLATTVCCLIRVTFNTNSEILSELCRSILFNARLNIKQNALSTIYSRGITFPVLFIVTMYLLNVLGGHDQSGGNGCGQAEELALCDKAGAPLILAFEEVLCIPLVLHLVIQTQVTAEELEGRQGHDLLRMTHIEYTLISARSEPVLAIKAEQSPERRVAVPEAPLEVFDAEVPEITRADRNNQRG